MRVAPLVIFLFLLAATAVAQTSPSSSDTQNQSGTSNSGIQTGDINQATQNPLGNPTQNPNVEKKQQPATFDVGNASTAGQDQVVGEVRLMTGYSEINQPGLQPGQEGRSFHTPGANDLAEFNYFEDHRFLLTQRLQVLSSFRATDDPSIDPEHDSLQKAYIRVYGPRDEVILGDALVNYSRLSFNQNIKGLSTSFKIGDNWKISDTAGVFIDRWGSLYKPFMALPGRPYLSFVAGARVERKLWRDSFLGFNFSSSNDSLDSLPVPADPATAPNAARNRVGTIDSKLSFKRIRIDDEFAYAFTNFDLSCTSAFSTCLPAAFSSQPPLIGMHGDWGGRLEGSWRYKRLNLRESYVRYQPNFASLMARQISDLQDLSVRASYDLTDWLLVDGTVRRSNNDLKRQLPFETTFWGPEAHFILHDLSFYKKGTLEVGYRHRNISSSEVNPAACVPVNGSPASCTVDQYVRIPYAEVGVPVGTAVFTIGYERQNTVDNVNALMTNNNNRFYAGLRGVFDLGGWHINPAIRLELNREAHRPGMTDTIPNLTLIEDSNRLNTIGIFIEPPKWFILELGYRDSSATISDFNQGAFVPAGFARPSYKAALTYKIRNDENTKFIFAFERNNNFYFTSPNFDERIWSGTLVYRFGKRGQ